MRTWLEAKTVCVVNVKVMLLDAVLGTRLDGMKVATLTSPPKDKGVKVPAESVDVETEADQPLQLVGA